jgi:hypothetical protein
MMSFGPRIARASCRSVHPPTGAQVLPPSRLVSYAVYRAIDPAMVNQVKPGDKSKFDVDRINGQLTVTKIEKAK